MRVEGGTGGTDTSVFKVKRCLSWGYSKLDEVVLELAEARWLNHHWWMSANHVALCETGWK